MSTHKLTEHVYSVGALNPMLRVFDIIMETEFGTTYNSYIVKGSEKTALIETCHKDFFEQYLKNIEEVCPLSEIDYIVLNHNEPDHSGALADLLERCPGIQVISSQAGALYLKNITNLPDLKVQVVKDGDSLSLGDVTLKFINAPFLHWPDSMFTWLEEEKVLFPCDFLGCHYCEPYVLDSRVVYPEKYEKAFRYYYDAIFGPFKPYVLKGLEKIEHLDIEMACPSHGPVLTKGCCLEYTQECYRKWSQPVERQNKLIPVFYTTAYGNTEMLAGKIADGILEVLPDADVPCYDIIDHDIDKLSALLGESDAFAIGSPTINRDAVPPVWGLLSHVDAINSTKKPALVFGSYGWSGEAVPNVTTRLQGLKMAVFGEGMKVCFVPSEEDMTAACELGKSFAQSLL